MADDKPISVFIRFTDLGEDDTEATEYSFATEAEKTAFMDGLYEGATMGGFEEVDAADIPDGQAVRIIPGR